MMLSKDICIWIPNLLTGECKRWIKKETRIWQRQFVIYWNSNTSKQEESRYIKIIDVFQEEIVKNVEKYE